VHMCWGRSGILTVTVSDGARRNRSCIAATPLAGAPSDAMLEGGGHLCIILTYGYYYEHNCNQCVWSGRVSFLVFGGGGGRDDIQ
jgi:hypothetical protein